MMHMTWDTTQENEKGQEATHKPIWLVITTGLTGYHNQSAAPQTTDNTCIFIYLETITQKP
jgi:hypothetical protein